VQAQPKKSDLYAFWRGLSVPERHGFADKAGTTYHYINTHLIHRRKQPRKETIRNLADSSNGHLTYEGLIDFFFA
jgi:hypothetical protein